MISLPTLMAMLGSGLCAGWLYHSWRTKSAAPWRRALPTAAVLACGGSWMAIHGMEFGTVYWLLTTSLAIWLLIATINRSEFRKSLSATAAATPSPSAVAPAREVWVRGASRLTIMLLLGCMTALLLSALCIALLPLTEASRLVFAAFTLPLLWSMFIVWCCADHQQWRPPVGMLMLSGTAASLLWILP